MLWMAGYFTVIANISPIQVVFPFLDRSGKMTPQLRSIYAIRVQYLVDANKCDQYR